MSLDNAYNSVSIGKNIQLVLFGFIVWLVPFVVSFFLYTPQGQPLVGVAAFNSIMSVILAFITGFAIIFYFKGITQNFLKEAITAGIVWLIMSVVIDLVILVPFAGMQLTAYASDVAIGYLVIPLITITAGKLLDAKLSHSKKIVSQFATSK